MEPEHRPLTELELELEPQIRTLKRALEEQRQIILQTDHWFDQEAHLLFLEYQRRLCELYRTQMTVEIQV